MSNPNVRDILAIQTSLLDWFRVFGRRFSWRQTRDPYAVLLAEKLLQQTAIRESLVQAYGDLLLAYPTPTALANADPDRIYALIQPLGLHYRAKELVSLAQEVSEKHNGQIPRDLKSLLSLPGVGDYAARAVLCFAFGHNMPVVDTNVARILYRLFGLPGKFPSNPARKRDLIDLATSLIPEGKADQFNWAMIDLGALICRSSKPKCGECPLQHLCSYDSSGGERYDS